MNNIQNKTLRTDKTFIENIEHKKNNVLTTIHVIIVVKTSFSMFTCKCNYCNYYLKVFWLQYIQHANLQPPLLVQMYLKSKEILNSQKYIQGNRDPFMVHYINSIICDQQVIKIGAYCWPSG